MTLKRIENIELYRIIAAWMVMIFHFICFDKEGQTFFDASTRSIATFGAQGVEFFYVISGFVMWYSMQHFQVKDSWTYLKKRFIRIIPVYWTTLVLIYLVQFIWSGGSHTYDLQTLFYNAFFLVGLDGHTPWMNLVFGTLQQEVIFYLSLLIIAPFLLKSRWFFIPLLVAALCLHPTFPLIEFFHFLPFFSLGILLAAYRLEKNKWYGLGMLSLITGLVLNYTDEDVVIGVISLIALLVEFKLPTQIQYLGKGSYAVYLTHGISGGTVLYFLYKLSFFQENTWLSVVIALGISISFAQLVYLWVEQPISRWLTKRWIN